MVTKGSGDEGKWWGREVVRKGSGRREVVTKGSDDEGEWWRREVVTKGSGEEGKWWWRGVATKGSREEGKWWWRGVVTKGSREEGKWWWRGVVTKGSGAHCSGCMMLHGLCFGEEAGARNLVFFRVKWLQPTMKGIPRLCDGCGCGRFVRELFLLCNEWLCLCA